MQEQRGGAELGRVADSQASRSDLPPPSQGLEGVDLRRKEAGSAREGPDRDSRAGVPGRLPGAGRRRCRAPH